MLIEHLQSNLSKNAHIFFYSLLQNILSLPELNKENKINLIISAKLSQGLIKNLFKILIN